MKRFICIFLISALVFSFASCSVKNEPVAEDTTVEETVPTTTLPVPEIAQSTHSKKFEDVNGRVVYTVDVNVPLLDEFENEVLKAQVNTLSTEIFEEACERAEMNIEKAADFMDSRNTDTPWARRIDFEVSFINGHYLSFIIKEYFSSFGSEGEPTYRSATFNVVDGSPCYLTDFAPDTSADELADKIVEKLLCSSVSSYFYGGKPLNEEQKQLVHDSFFYENFYLTADGVGFYMSSYVFNPMHSGVYTVHCTWDELSGIMALPE